MTAPDPFTDTALVPAVGTGPTAAMSPAAAPPDAAGPDERVVCPECGTPAFVTLNRRDAKDFCVKCDFPLFWTPSAIVRDAAGQSAADSLRRLPGMHGRATVASQPCPHCHEPNSLSATVCLRCGRPMVLEAPPPPPAPVYVAPPPAPVYEEPEERGVPWWVWLLVGLVTAAVVTLAVLAGTGFFS